MCFENIYFNSFSIVLVSDVHLDMVILRTYVKFLPLKFVSKNTARSFLRLLSAPGSYTNLAKAGNFRVVRPWDLGSAPAALGALSSQAAAAYHSFTLTYEQQVSTPPPRLPLVLSPKTISKPDLPDPTVCGSKQWTVLNPSTEP